MEADGDGINPVANNHPNSAYLMGQSIFDPLFTLDAEGNWFPYLAESASRLRARTRGRSRCVRVSRTTTVRR